MRKSFFLLLFLCFAYTLPAQICQAAFLTDGSNITVKFTDISTSTAGDQIISWTWDFDDNDNTSAEQNPSYTFSEPGNFNVELEITTQSGCTDRYTAKVRTCVLNVDYQISQCSSGMINLSLGIFDPYDSAEEIDIVLDGQSVIGGPFVISEISPLFIELAIAGDGLEHELVVSSLEREGCMNSIAFTVPDCGSDCFLSGLDLGYPEGTVHFVSIGDNFFSPASVGIVLGDVVRFNWIDGGHSTTSDVTSGVDAWNSAVLSAGSQFDVRIQNPGVHQYYCIPHGNPGGIGMSGSILANCPDGTNMDLLIKFMASQTSNQGFQISFDGVPVAQSPFNYQGIGMQSQLISIAGDGLNHTIEVTDVADPSCAVSLDFIAPDCNQGGGDPVCSLDFELGTPIECLSDGTVDYPIKVIVANGSASFNVVLNGSTPVSFDYSGPVTNIVLNVPGDGSEKTIVITDNQKSECSASKSFTSPDCSLPCNITELAAGPLSSGLGGTTHVVNVEDFQFNPNIVNITEGDLVEWRWTGDIPHSTTSDVSSGADSWDSGVIGNGSTFSSPALSAGEHRYYCIPHGGAGGEGMSAKIIVLPACNAEDEVSIKVSFQITNKRGAAYGINVDGVLKSTVEYSTGSFQESIVLVKGDGMMHNIEIVDNQFMECKQATQFISPDCGGGQEPICEISLSVGPLETCVENELQFDLNVYALNQSDSFELHIDQVLNGKHKYAGALTTLNLSIPGDGLVHSISVTDGTDKNCTVATEVKSVNCSLPCTISNFEVKPPDNNSTGNIHVINVEDFQFNPQQIEIFSGDLVEWVWTGQVAHTTTSDAIEGANSWQSDLLNNGATFLSPELSIGEHRYYCEPHGGPNGAGMAGIISVLPECSETMEAIYHVSFLVSNKGGMGYTVFVDGIESHLREYSEGDNQEIFVGIPGDGKIHTVMVRDNENIDCNALDSFASINCNPENCEGIDVNFSSEIDYGINQVTFSNNSSGVIQEAIWDFGDGSFSTELSPVHEYIDTGTFIICLTILDQNDCSSIFCDQIVIDNNVCEADFEYQKSGSSYLFINKSKVASSSYQLEWDFGDGNTIKDKDTVEHTFSNGVFEVCLNVQSENCETSYCQNIDLSNPCALIQSGFAYQTDPSSNLLLTFNDVSSGLIDSWLWGFGDGTTSRDSLPVHEYASPGNYSVCLLIENEANGCFSSFCEEIEIISTNVDNYVLEDRILVYPNPQFTNRSILISLENVSIQSGEIDLEIYSSEGVKRIEDQVHFSELLEIQLNLEAGLYFLRLRSRGKIYSASFVIQE